MLSVIGSRRIGPRTKAGHLLLAQLNLFLVPSKCQPNQDGANHIGLVPATLVWYQPHWFGASHIGLVPATLVWYQPHWFGTSHIGLVPATLVWYQPHWFGASHTRMVPVIPRCVPCHTRKNLENAKEPSRTSRCHDRVCRPRLRVAGKIRMEPVASQH